MSLKSWVRQRLPEPTAEAVAKLLFELKAARISRRAEPAFRALGGRTGLKVHLGSGPDLRRGWINIDLATGARSGGREESDGTWFVNHDLRRGLPLADGSCAYIYSAHFFEHVAYAAGFRLIQECHRVLAPGGVLRTALPNFPGMFEAYLRGDRAYFDLIDLKEMMPQIEPGTETLVDHVNYGVYQHGEHVMVYDAEKFMRLLQKAGFAQIEVTGFEAGIDQEAELRRRYSFYVRGVKPL